MTNRNVSVVIPNLNGMEYLPKCVLSLFRAFEVYPGDHEIIVVDNGSTDGGVEWLRAHHSTIKVIAMGHNTGFAGACNEGVRQSQNEVVVLLNNDTFVCEDFFQALIRHFADDKELFAVTCRLIDWYTGKFQLGRRRWIFERGIIGLDDEKGDSHSSVCTSAAISGSACAIRRDHYMELGGFGPFHRWNDVDFSYRAQKRGWKILYEPQSVVYHLGMATDRKVWTGDEIAVIWCTEMFLVTWRNITEMAFMVRHLVSLPFILRRFGARSAGKGFFRALKELPAVWRFRAEERRYLLLTDPQLVQCQS